MKISQRIHATEPGACRIYREAVGEKPPDTLLTILTNHYHLPPLTVPHGRRGMWAPYETATGLLRKRLTVSG